MTSTGPRTFATFGEAFRAAMEESARDFVNPFYPCDMCGEQTPVGKLRRTPGGCGSVCSDACIFRWRNEVLAD